MIPVYICDDDREMLEHLTKLINNIIVIQGYDMETVLADPNPEVILKHREGHQSRSIYFLDVDLKHPEYDGFTLGRNIRQLDPRGFIIFVTTHGELMPETFRYRLEAMSYLVKDEADLLKPRLRECLEQVEQLAAGGQKDEEGYFTAKVADVTYQIPVKEIYYFETTSPHRVLLHAENRRLEFRGELSAVEREVGDGFIRTHQSYLVRREQIVKVNGVDSSVQLKNGELCMLSRKGKKLLKEFMEK